MEFYGWKILTVRNGNLQSPVRHTIWPKNEYLVAKSFPDLKEGDNPRGGPGIHLVTDKALSELFLYANSIYPVLVKVKCAGRVYVGDNGVILTEKARPVEAYVSSLSKIDIDQLERDYNISVKIIEDFVEQREFAFDDGITIKSIEPLSNDVFGRMMVMLSGLADFSENPTSKDFMCTVHQSDNDVGKFAILDNCVVLDFMYYYTEEILRAIGTFIYLYFGEAIDLSSGKVFKTEHWLQLDAVNPTSGSFYGINNPIGIVTDPHTMGVILDRNMKLEITLDYNLHTKKVKNFLLIDEVISDETISGIRPFFESQKAYLDTDTEEDEGNYSQRYVENTAEEIEIKDTDDMWDTTWWDLLETTWAHASQQNPIDTEYMYRTNEFGIIYSYETIGVYYEPRILDFSYQDFLNILKEALEIWPDVTLLQFFELCGEVLEFMYSYLPDIYFKNEELRYDWHKILLDPGKIRTDVKKIIEGSNRGHHQLYDAIVSYIRRTIG